VHVLISSGAMCAPSINADRASSSLFALLDSTGDAITTVTDPRPAGAAHLQSFG
jgi:hypothetical protein